MEQALVEKLKNGTADDIDIDMIASRCMNANEKLLDLISTFLDQFEKLTEEYEQEFKIGKCTLVMGYIDQPVKMMGKGAAAKVVYGSGPYARDLLNQLQEEAK